jgi:hypothetical protein
MQVDKKDDELFRTQFHFEVGWCEKFLRHLGQSEHPFDKTSGKRIVRTAAILAKIESEINNRLNDCRLLLVNIDASKNLVFLDDVLELRVYQHKKEETIFGLDLRLLRGEDEVMQAHATVAGPQAYDWEA